MAFVEVETKPVSSSLPVLSTLPVFQEGNYNPTTKTVETSDSSKPPKPLLIVSPTVQGTFPVILFFHGFYLRNHFYTDLLQHISSHGFIIVAPQLYNIIPASGTEEVDSAAEVADWLPSGLQNLLPSDTWANLLKLALVGHSRGGKTAFAVALGHGNSTQKFSALVGIDPVAGFSKNCRTQPHILQYTAGAFDLSIPVTVIGTGLGGDMNCLMPPCAPKDVNHEEFFYECRPPCAHLVAADYGHMDVLNDDPPGIAGLASNCTCVNGKGRRDLMRKCVGGIVVAFLNAYFEGESTDFMTIMNEPSVAPVKLDEVEFIEA